MKNNKGISLISLSIYVIVAAVVVGILAFMNVNFFSKISGLTGKTEIVNEHMKFLSAFLQDAKSCEKISEYTAWSVKFPNGSNYEIKKIEGEGPGANKYAIYRNNVKISEGIVDSWYGGTPPAFDYDYGQNVITISLTYADEERENEWIENATYKVGRGY